LSKSDLERRTRLVENIRDLEAAELKEVMAIVHEHEPVTMNQADDEMELDLLSLKAITVKKLVKLVRGIKLRKVSRANSNKRKLSERPAAAVADYKSPRLDTCSPTIDSGVDLNDGKHTPKRIETLTDSDSDDSDS
jgi:hypothetical protein